MIDPTLKNARILIVDDQEANIDVLSGLLEMQGYHDILTTTDSRLVVGLYASFAPDLILLDLMMPWFSGFEVMEQLSALIPENTYLPVLILTADITPEAKKRALLNGAKDFLSKPFDLVEVGLRIDNLLFARILHQQALGRNLILEERVRERTAELEKSNCELIAATEHAKTGDRLKSAFIRNISHEIRTPLNGILGMYKILTDPALSKEDRDENLVFLQKSSNRLIRTVTDMMDISLLVSETMPVSDTTFDPVVLMELLYKDFQKICEPGRVTFTHSTKLPAGHVTITSDRELLYKIFSRLLENAAKFTHKGTISFGFEVQEMEVEFFVRDTGVGIEKEFQSAVFEPFMQENALITRGHEGNGLGLSIASRLVRLLGGEIRLESDKGEGAAFFFKLPFKPIDSTITEAGSTTPVKQKGPLSAVLIADDDVLSRKFMEFIVCDYTTAVYHAKNGQEAVAVCRKHPEISMVLMDLKMPVMSGFDATQEIRRFNCDMVIIAQSAFSDSQVRNDAMKAGCNNFITKPVDEVLLLAMMADYFDIE
ncbi:MAG: response regulator [Bacteroidota bacterium]